MNVYCAVHYRDLASQHAVNELSAREHAARMIGDEAPHVPIMFLSAKGLQREVQTAFDCGPSVVDYLVKPVAPDQLVQRVDQILHVSTSVGLETVRRESLSRDEMVYVQR